MALGTAAAIAQQVEAIAPNLVTTDERGDKSVNYALTALIEAVKELKKQNDELRARVTQLEQQK